MVSLEVVFIFDRRYVAFTTAPLAIATVMGLLFCVIALLLIVFIFVRTMIWGDPTSGWPSLVCIIFFISGIQLFCLGIIGQYLSKTYLETKKKKNYNIIFLIYKWHYKNK